MCNFLPEEEMGLPSLWSVKTRSDKTLKNNSLVVTRGMF